MSFRKLHANAPSKKCDNEIIGWPWKRLWQMLMWKHVDCWHANYDCTNCQQQRLAGSHTRPKCSPVVSSGNWWGTRKSFTGKKQNKTKGQRFSNQKSHFWSPQRLSVHVLHTAQQREISSSADGSSDKYNFISACLLIDPSVSAILHSCWTDTRMDDPSA